MMQFEKACFAIQQMTVGKLRDAHSLQIPETPLPQKSSAIIQHLKKVALWKAMSASELMREWHRLEMKCPTKNAHDSLKHLIIAHWGGSKPNKEETLQISPEA